MKNKKIRRDGKYVKCPLCNGEGYINREAYLNDLGMEERAYIERLWKGFDANGTKVFQTIIKEFKEASEEKNRSVIEKIKEENESGREKKDNTIQDLKEKIKGLDNELKEKEKLVTKYETEFKKIPTLIGQQGEKDFEAEACKRFPHFEISNKLGKNGDFLIIPIIKIGNALIKSKVRIVIDRKKNKQINDQDVQKLLKDMDYNNAQIGMVIVDSEEKLRRKDIEKAAWTYGDKLVILTDTERWYKDLQILEPTFKLFDKKEENDKTDYSGLLSKTLNKITEKLNDFNGFHNYSTAIRRECDKSDGLANKLKTEINKVCMGAFIVLNEKHKKIAIKSPQNKLFAVT